MRFQRFFTNNMGRLGDIESGDAWTVDVGFDDPSPVYFPQAPSPGSAPVVTPPGGGVISQATVDTIKQLILTGQQVLAQERILDVNAQRARSGLAPIDPSYFSPQARVNVGLTPAGQQTLLYMGLAALGFLAFSKLGRK